MKLKAPSPFWISSGLVAFYLVVALLAISLPFYEFLFWFISFCCIGLGAALVVWARVVTGRWW